MMSWSLAFVVHSTFWLGLAWLSTSLFPRMHSRTRETIWFTAIVASFIGPSVSALAPGAVPSLWRLVFPESVFSFAGAASGSVDVPGSSAAWLGFEAPLLWTWLAITGVLLLRYAVQLAVLRRRLARRDFDDDSAEAVTLREVSHLARLRRPPRFTQSDNLGSPIAMGVGNNAEVCVPTRALHELGSEQFRAMLSHEVAHHMRRDPVRLGLMSVLGTVFFFQPLLSVARRDMHWAAEEQCDAWAARQVKDPLTVARCLTEVAGWVLPRERRLPVVGMMRGRSHLVRRVNQLIARRGDLGPRGRSWRRLVSASVLVLAPWLAPGLVHPADVSGEVTPPPVTASAVPPSQVEEGAVRRSSEHDGPRAGDDHNGRDEHERARDGARESERNHGAETRDEPGHDGRDEEQAVVRR